MSGPACDSARGGAPRDARAHRLRGPARPRRTPGGQKRRLDVGIGLMHLPQLLFLDEPTTGLDPQSRARMWDEVRRLRDIRHHGVPHHPLPRGGRRALRPHRDHRPRQDRRRGHARGAEAGDRRRRGRWWGRTGRATACSRHPQGPGLHPRATDGGRRCCASTSTAARPRCPRSSGVLDGAGMARRIALAAPSEPRRRLPAPDRALAPRDGAMTRRSPRWRTDVKLLRDTWLMFRRYF